MTFKIEHMKYLALITLFFVVACSQPKETKIDEDTLGFIDADLDSDETNFKMKADFNVDKPAAGNTIERAFENAPPMIPHTTAGFFPIKMDNNICLSCHMPDKVAESGAREISKTHFQSWRPSLKEENGKYSNPDNSEVFIEKMDVLNNAYFHCSQCHVPQANVTINIKNLFTREFRETFGIEESDLKEKVNEGIN
jgi:cytochrome c-type protein NapB